MAEVLDRLQIYGMSRDDEAVYLSSLLTGEPTLLICSPGSAKTTLMRKTAKALNVAGAIYNAAHVQFEDMIGFLDMKAMGEGRMAYIETPVSIWGKKFVGLDEANRPTKNNENKLLDFMADGTMLGKDTGVTWKIGAMNPFGSDGTNRVGGAMLGRFASFLFVAELLDMSSGEQEAVIRNLSDKNLPAITHWTKDPVPDLGDSTDYKAAGDLITAILRQAADHYQHLKSSVQVLPRFMSRFAVAIAADTSAKKDEQIRIDGRRAGFIYRLILAVRAVEVARANVLRLTPKPFHESVRIGIRYGLPIGVNEEGGRGADAFKKVEHVITNLLPFLSENKDLQALEVQFELLTTTDIFRKTELLLKYQDRLDRIVRSAAWTRITQADGFDGSLVGFMANQVEIVRPGTIPPDVLDGLTKLMNGRDVVPRSFPIPPHLKEYEKRLGAFMEQKTMLGRLVATHLVSEFAGSQMGLKKDASAVSTDIDELESRVKTDVKKAKALGETMDKMLVAA